MNELIAGLVSAAITAVITYLATVAKVRLDLSAEYDRELRSKRLDAYKELWKRMEPLARFSQTPLSYRKVRDTSEDMRDWYFGGGGLFLSQASRKPYFDLKETLQQIIDDAELQKEEDRPLEDERTRRLLRQGKLLRRRLADDIGTRKALFVR